MRLTNFFSPCAFSLRPLASYRQDPWSLWWLADDARLGWGGEWRGDYLRADALDLSAGLGVEWAAQGWLLRPSFRLRTESGGRTWKTGADLFAEWAHDGWTFRPSVRAADMSRFSNAHLRLHAAREF